MSTEEAKLAIQLKLLLIRNLGIKSYYIFPISIRNNIVCGYINIDKQRVLQLKPEDYSEYTYVTDCKLVSPIEKTELTDLAKIELLLKDMGY